MKKRQFCAISKCILIVKSINNAVIFLLLPILLICVFTKNVYAAGQSIRVSPIINDLQLTPGETTILNLSVENLSDSPLGIHAEISGFDETGQNISTDRHSSALTKWTDIPTPDIILDPLSQKSISVNIAPPKDAKQNGYYETIFLSPVISSKKEPANPIVLTRIGVIVLGTIGKLNYDDLAKKVSVEDFKPEKYVFNNSEAVLNFSVENKYFTHFTAKPFVTIKPLFGQEKTTLLEEKRVLPGTNKAWKFQTALGKNIFFKAKLAVSVGSGNQVFAETWFVALPFRHTVEIIILAVTVLIAILARKRIKKAIATLFGKTSD
jgi:hypothetical protein